MTQLIDGRYEVIKPLSAGGFGVTFLAKDLRRPGQPRCVVKQLRPRREFSAEGWQAARRLFDQEAEILERLGRHDQIPLLLAHLEENGNFYIVQDFIEGCTFRAELLAVKRLPEKEVITLLRQGLTVLSYVHQQGVIHRDIKPENLIRRQDGVLCLIDFGIVKEFSAQNLSRMVSPQAGLASTTVSIGTEGYTPLEQIRGKPCPASDVYALGMVAIEAITGKSPRDLPDDPATMEVVWQPGTPVSPALAKVLTNMVRFNYGRRYADGATALKALETALAPPVSTVVVSPKALEQIPVFQSLEQAKAEYKQREATQPQPKEVERKRQSETTAKRQREDAERQRQAKVEAQQRKQREVAEASKRQKATINKQPKLLTRQQILKWGGLIGLGVVGAFGIYIFNGPSLSRLSFQLSRSSDAGTPDPPVSEPGSVPNPVVDSSPGAASIAQQVIEEWLTAKQAAVGKNYQSDRLEEILLEPLLTEWRQRSEAAFKENWYWEYEHSVEVQSVTPDNSAADQLQVVAVVQENARLFEYGVENTSASYNDRPTVQYDLVRQNGKWYIQNIVGNLN